MQDPAHFDPTKIRLDPPPAFAGLPTYQDLMAEQLRRAPWLGISLVFHGLLVLILLSLPPSGMRREEDLLRLTVAAPEEAPLIEEPPEEPLPEPELPEEQEPSLTETLAPQEEPTDTMEDEPLDLEDSPVDSAFEEEALNDVIGIGGGGGRRPGGGRPGRKKRAPRKILPIVDTALRWLRDHQSPDGRWSSAGFMRQCPEGDLCDGPGNPTHDVGLTGLALLAFLGDGSTLRSGRFRKSLRKGVRWLLGQMDEEGLIGEEHGHGFMYNHALASLALVEAYGLSGYRTLRGRVQRCVDYIQRARNPYKVWRYYPRDGDNDSSVTGWMVFVLKSASDFELVVDKEAMSYSLAWFREVTEPSTGQCGYTRRGEGSSRREDMMERFPASRTEAMTAVGLLCRIFLGEDPEREPTLLAAADTLLKKPPVWNPGEGTIDLYYWYYASYALFQMGGSRWNQWRAHMQKALARTQRKDRHRLGSWDPVSAWGEDGGRVYSTALGTLCLEAYYRYSRLVR